MFTRLADKAGAILPPGAVLSQVTLLLLGIKRKISLTYFSMVLPEYQNVLCRENEQELELYVTHARLHVAMYVQTLRQDNIALVYKSAALHINNSFHHTS